MHGNAFTGCFIRRLVQPPVGLLYASSLGFFPLQVGFNPATALQAMGLGPDDAPQILMCPFWRFSFKLAPDSIVNIHAVCD